MLPVSSRERIVLVGGPRSGKSTLARELRAKGIPTFCGDPLSKVKEPEEGVTYLPEGLPMAGDEGPSVWIAQHWFTMPGPWCCEGWVMARALRRWLRAYDLSRGDGRTDPSRTPCDRIIVLRNQHLHAVTKAGQLAQGKGVFTVWDGISRQFRAITEER